MKAKHSKEPNDYKLIDKDHYRVFDFNWDNIRSFDDFKKANLLLNSLNEIRFYFIDDDLFGKWINKNPDFEKYFMVCY